MAVDARDTDTDAPTAGDERRGVSAGGVLKLLAALVVLLVVAGLVALALGWRPVADVLAKQTVDRSSPAVLRSLEKLTEFHASTGHFEVIVDLEEDTPWVPSWLSGERVLFVGVGTVDSVVSFEGLDESRITVSDEGDSVTVRLPEPTLEEPQIDIEQSYLYARQRGVLERVGGLFGGQSVDQPAYQQALEQMRTAAAADGQILELGRQNTTSMLQSMLGALGYSSVTVEYEGGEG
jgi:hypothetical protein